MLNTNEELRMENLIKYEEKVSCYNYLFNNIDNSFSVKVQEIKPGIFYYIYCLYQEDNNNFRTPKSWVIAATRDAGAEFFTKVPLKIIRAIKKTDKSYSPILRFKYTERLDGEKTHKDFTIEDYQNNEDNIGLTEEDKKFVEYFVNYFKCSRKLEIDQKFKDFVKKHINATKTLLESFKKMIKDNIYVLNYLLKNRENHTKLYIARKINTYIEENNNILEYLTDEQRESITEIQAEALIEEKLEKQRKGEQKEIQTNVIETQIEKCKNVCNNKVRDDLIKYLNSSGRDCKSLVKASGKLYVYGIKYTKTQCGDRLILATNTTWENNIKNFALYFGIPKCKEFVNKFRDTWDYKKPNYIISYTNKPLAIINVIGTYVSCSGHLTADIECYQVIKETVNNTNEEENLEQELEQIIKREKEAKENNPLLVRKERLTTTLSIEDIVKEGDKIFVFAYFPYNKSNIIECKINGGEEQVVKSNKFLDDILKNTNNKFTVMTGECKTHPNIHRKCRSFIIV